MFLSNALKHFITITKHKLTVMDLCFKVGMIKQGLLHDLSKYSCEEFITGVKYYQGFRSPNTAEKLELGYSLAWLHHKGRNKHHFEYWIDYGMNPSEGLMGMKMPLRYVLEMCCDRIAASKVYKGKDYNDAVAWEYYESRKHYMVIHDETRRLLEKVLLINKEYGEKKALAFMRYMYKHPKLYDGREFK